ncbi:unnamed protein product, partial [marine sediment metagenome]
YLSRLPLEGYDSDGAASWARKAVEAKVDPIKAFNAMTGVMKEIGDDFERGELWLPDLVGAADAMQSATPILDKEIKRTGAKKQAVGTVVAGTVSGDIHAIGITMVCTLLVAAGFDVHMLGINIKSEQFVEAVKQHKADILAMSALLTLTAREQKKVIDALNKEGIRDKVKVMVGGGAINADFARNIGADGYDPTAPGAVELARRLVGAG